MKTSRWMNPLSVCLIVALVLACGLAPARANAPGGRPTAPPPDGGGFVPPPDGGYQPVPGPQPGPVSITGVYSDIIREANASPVQQKTIGNIIREEEKALAQFDKENAKRLEDLRKGLAEATQRLADLMMKYPDTNTIGAGPKAQMDGAQKQIALFQRQIDLVAANRDRVANLFKNRAVVILSPAQKAAWASYILNQIMAGEFQGVGLGAEQQAKVKMLCDQAGRMATKTDVAADKQLVDTLKQQIVVQVLDEQQRGRYMQVLQERLAAKNAPPDGAPPPMPVEPYPAPYPAPVRPTAPPPDRPTAPPPT